MPEIDETNVKIQGTVNVEHSLRENENLQKDLDQQLSWNPVRELTKINICNNRFTNSLPRPESSTKMSNFIVELNDGYEKILWKDVYGALRVLVCKFVQSNHFKTGSKMFLDKVPNDVCYLLECGYLWSQYFYDLF